MSHPLTACISEIELLQERIAEKNDRIEALESALMAEWAARDNRIEALEFELKAAKSEIEIADSVIEQKHARIEALEKALREIVDVWFPDEAIEIASAALAEGQDKP